MRAYVATAHRLIEFLGRYRGEAVGASSLLELGSADLRLGYEGAFNGDSMSHAGNVSFVLPIGSHAEPPSLVPPLLPPPQGSAS